MSDANIDPDITPVDPAAAESDETTTTDTTSSEQTDQAATAREENSNPAHGETLGGARPDAGSTASKDPDDWVTGDEPITGPQKSYLDTLAREAGEEPASTSTASSRRPAGGPDATPPDGARADSRQTAPGPFRSTRRSRTLQSRLGW
jgi:hypothetical protein